MINDTSKRQEISEEMADVLYFLIRLSQRYNIDLTTELNKKIQKNEQKYPIEKAKGSNKKYTEY
jgi:NTP pyrophosphatase (non-canonical NTP hydrolase)